MCSSGLEALSFPFSTKFLRSKDLRFTTLPAIATYTLLGNRASFSSACLSVVLGVRWNRHTLCQALVCALAGAAWQCVWLVSIDITRSVFYIFFSSLILSLSHQTFCLQVFFQKFPDFGPYVR